MDDRTTVLLIEDDQNIVDLVRANLMARDHEVVVSKEGPGSQPCSRWTTRTSSCWT